MAFATYAGSFTAQSGTGNQDITLPSGVVTAMNAGPYAVIFTAPSDITSTTGTWHVNTYQFIGYAASTGGIGGITQYAASMWSGDAATSNARRRAAAKCITQIEGSSATYYEADFIGTQGATAMRINWTTNLGTTSTVLFKIITGVTSAKVQTWTTLSGTGSKAVTGVGFTPDLVLHAMTPLTALPSNSTEAYLSFGAMNKNGEQWANSIASQNGVSPSNTGRGQRTDECLLSANWDQSVITKAEYVSMDADGFHVNFSTGAGALEQVGSLCLAGIASKIGSFSKTTSVSTQTVTSSQSFAPLGAIFTTNGNTSTASPSTNATWGLGFDDLTNARAAYSTDIDNSSPTHVSSVWSSSKSLILHSGSGTTDSTASVTATSTSSFTLTYSASTTNTSEVLYLLVGSSNTAPTIAFGASSLADGAFPTTTTPTLTAYVTDPDSSQTLTVTYEVATDSGFASIVYTGTNTAASPQTAGAVSKTITALSKATLYYWRARVSDGTATSANTATRTFTIYDDPVIAIGASTPATTTSTGGPTLNVGWTYTQGQSLAEAFYRVQVQTNGGATTYYDTGTLAGPATSVALDAVALAIPTDTTSTALQVVVTVTAATTGTVVSATKTFDIQWGVVTVGIVSPSNGAIVATTGITAQWTFASTRSKLQGSYRIRLMIASTGSVLLDTGFVTSAATSVAVAVVLVDGSTYSLEVTLKNDQGVLGT